MQGAMFGTESRNPIADNSNQTTPKELYDSKCFRPVQIIDIKLLEPFKNPSDQKLAMETYGARHKLLVVLSPSNKSKPEKIKLWVTDVRKFGKDGLDLLAKFRNNIVQVTANKGMREFSELRLKLLDEYKKNMEADFMLDAIQEEYVQGTTNIVPPKIVSNLQQSSTVERNTNSPIHKDKVLVKEEEGWIAPEKMSIPEPKQQVSPKSAPRKRIFKPMKTADLQEKIIKQEENFAEPKPPKITNRPMQKKVTFEDEFTNGLLPSEENTHNFDCKVKLEKPPFELNDYSRQSAAVRKEIEKKLDFVINIQLNEILLEIKKKYFGEPTIHRSQMTKELEALHARISDIVKQAENNQMIFE